MTSEQNRVVLCYGGLFERSRIFSLTGRMEKICLARQMPFRQPPNQNRRPSRCLPDAESNQEFEVLRAIRARRSACSGRMALREAPCGSSMSQDLDEIVSGAVTGVEEIASRENCSTRQVNMTVTLAFLAPDLVRAAVEGRLPRGIGVERLRDAPPERSRQFEALGLNPQ